MNHKTVPETAQKFQGHDGLQMQVRVNYTN
jgi:hypothetical protein